MICPQIHPKSPSNVSIFLEILRISINEIFAITIILCIIDWFVTDSLCVCSESSKESLILTPMKWCQVRFQCEVGHMECISRVLSIEPLTSQAINVAAIKATVVRYSQSFWLCYGDCLRRGEARRDETGRGGRLSLQRQILKNLVRRHYLVAHGHHCTRSDLVTEGISILSLL